MSLSYYHYAGLRIAAGLPIPEWAVFEQPQLFDSPDVTIFLRPATPVDPTQACLTADEYCFVIPETGTYWVRQGREVFIAPAPGAGEQELRLFLLGAVWGALCYQRGILALHMSVVQVGQQAVAFCGATGAGKSSMSAALVADGYPLIGDDLCCFDLSGPAPRIFPSVPRLKLWRDALTHLGWNTDDLVRDHFRLDKFHVTDAPNMRADEIILPLPVRAIYVLEWGKLRLTRLTGLNALQRLVASATYRPELIEPMGKSGFYWEQCAQLARAAPVWELRRPRDWDQMPDTVARLAEAWADA